VEESFSSPDSQAKLMKLLDMLVLVHDDVAQA